MPSDFSAPIQDRTHFNMSPATVTPAAHDPGLAQRQAIRARIQQVAQSLQLKGLSFRSPPPEPTTCCGRGCNGCVWEGYDAALMWWYEDGGALLAG